MLSNQIFNLIKSNNLLKRLVRKLVLVNINIYPSILFINKLYNKLDFENKAEFHSIFAKHFREKNKKLALKKWKIIFNKKSLLMPLNKDRLWLDWDSALSILGHDVDVKKTYEYLLNNNKINCFFDVGANYCTHSLLFLKNNVNTYSFEPNINCYDYFSDCLKANNLKGNFINIAIGNENGEAELTFPENDTWLGTISAKDDDFVNKFGGLKKIKVEIDSLDNYCNAKNILPDLIKIDTEGFEIDVLIGAKEILEKKEPIVIFEANEKEKREALYVFLQKTNYNIYQLINNVNEFLLLNSNSFINNKENNFIAIPSNHIILGKK